MILVDFFCKSHYTYISVNVKDTEPDVTGNVFELRFLQKKEDSFKSGENDEDICEVNQN